MIPKTLTLKNYKCYQEGEINFDNFNIAVIIGQQSGNANVSNAVGKTAIFNAIEYCLFNYSQSKLDSLINDNATDMCVSLSFSIDNSIYRIDRKRSTKSSDVSLFQQQEDLSWKDLSGRTSSNTETLIKNLLNIDFNVFKSTAYFSQNDDFSLALITPEKRKKLLKDILNIAFYAKLEKAAKDRFSKIEKSNLKILAEEKFYKEKIFSDEKLQELDFANAQIDAFLESNEKDITLEKSSYQIAADSITTIENEITSLNKDNHDLIKKIETSTLELKNSQILFDRQFADYNTNIYAGNSLIARKKEIVEKISECKIVDLEEQSNVLSELKTQEVLLASEISSISKEILLLKEPSIVSDVCNLCGSKLDKEHLEKEKARVVAEKVRLTKKANDISKDSSILKKKIADQVSLIDKSKKESLLLSKLETEKTDISTKIAVHREKCNSVKTTLKLSEERLTLAKETHSALPSLVSINEIIDNKTKLITDWKSKVRGFQTKIDSLSKLQEEKKIQKAINNKSLVENIELQKALDALQESKTLSDEEIRLLTLTIKAFSSTGIPSIIISSILDELQDEANTILNKIHPGLQLQFLTENERSKDKELEDKLNIAYFIHNKERSYEELSGAQSISVQFALKIGLAFLLKRSSNYNFGLLLLDEVDSPLDKQSIGFFSEVLKTFQDDFKIITITHNDYSKEKIPNHILIEQDKTKMITRIKN